LQRISISLLLLLLPWLAAVAQAPRYSWKNVQIVGGGFVDGILFDPVVPGLRYARTDIGGAYRWDQPSGRWLPLMDWVSYKDRNLMGVASLAIDPSDPNRVYFACGTYSSASAPEGAILRSSDRGRTFQRTNLPLKFGANEDGRGNGERLAVDPQDGRILYVGTRHDGLWRSRDRGVSWAKVANFPDVTESGKTAAGDGIIFVHFDPQPAPALSHAPTATIYVGVSLMGRPNLFVSTDAGATWNPVAGQPTQYRPTRAALSSDGFFYIAYGTAPGPSRMTNGAVWKLNTRTGAWTDITPDRPAPGREFGYAAVAVDAHHPGRILASTFGRPWSDGASDTIFRSTDGGATWKMIFGGKASGAFDFSGAPYVKPTPIHWLFDIEIDPADSNHAVFTTGYGGWETHDLTSADRRQPTHWTILATGIEETVALALNSPAEGAPLISAIGDYGGFVHWDLDRSPLEGSSAPPRFGNTTDVESASLRPQVVVRVGINADHATSPSLGYSLDEGHTWKPTPSQPSSSSQGGSVAVSADGSKWIWTPNHQPPFLTRDHGVTWKPVQGLPPGTRVISDPADPHAFYAVSLANHLLFRSTDGGATFSPQPFILQNAPKPSPAGDPRGGEDRLYAAPGRNGDLWFAASDGLYHLPALPPAGAAAQSSTFARLTAVSAIQAFGFGKSGPHHDDPTLYLAGTVKGQPGVFRSLDEGRSWARINDNQHQWGLILQITGDPRIFGRVYVGTHGRGILYGDPVTQNAARVHRKRASAHQ
jgi:photosystem II stability/assembly factor-like uncharacterized protein